MIFLFKPNLGNRAVNVAGSEINSWKTTFKDSHFKTLHHSFSLNYILKRNKDLDIIHLIHPTLEAPLLSTNILVKGD